MKEILLLAFGLMLVQAGLTYLQIKACDKTIKNANKNGVFGVGSKKGRTKAGNVVVMCSDEEGILKEAYIMKGVTVFARFKPIQNVCGRHIHELIEEYSNKEENDISKSMIQALQTIDEKLYT